MLHKSASADNQQIPTSNLARTILVIYGWESNPYAECAIRALLARGLRVLFVTRQTSTWALDGEGFEAFPLFPGHRKSRSYLGMLWQEAKALRAVLGLWRRRRPDLVHFQSFRMIRLDWILFLILRLLGARSVFTIHDTSSLEKSAIDSWIFRQTAKRANRLLVHTKHSRSVVMREWGVSPDRIEVIPHGGYDDYYNACGDRTAARARLGLGQEVTLLAFGNIREYKGLDYLIPAVRRAGEAGRHCRLIIAGRAHDKPLGDRYRTMIRDLGLQDWVELRDRFIETEEVETLFTAADLVVLPYVRIDQSGVLFLAYTFGKPVLATTVGGLPELVEPGRTGFLVPPADVEGLAKAIDQATAEIQALGAMGREARARIDNDFSWSRQAEITASVYSHLLEKD